MNTASSAEHAANPAHFSTPQYVRFQQQFDALLLAEGVLTTKERQNVVRLVADHCWAAALVILTFPPLWRRLGSAMRFDGGWSYLEEEPLEAARGLMSHGEILLIDAAMSLLNGHTKVNLMETTGTLCGKHLERFYAGIFASEHVLILHA
jgi:hypothetical protein